MTTEGSTAGSIRGIPAGFTAGSASTTVFGSAGMTTFGSAGKPVLGSAGKFGSTKRRATILGLKRLGSAGRAVFGVGAVDPLDAVSALDARAVLIEVATFDERPVGAVATELNVGSALDGRAVATLDVGSTLDEREMLDALGALGVEDALNDLDTLDVDG